jgi:hypothetical protein
MDYPFKFDITFYDNTISARPNPSPSTSLELQPIYLSRVRSAPSLTSRVVGSGGDVISYYELADLILKIFVDRMPLSTGLYVLLFHFLSVPHIITKHVFLDHLYC